MTELARLDLKMGRDEKDVVSRGAAIMGTSLSAFVRSAAKEKAIELIERESRVAMSSADFAAFADAINQPFTPNAAAKKSMLAASNVKRA